MTEYRVVESESFPSLALPGISIVQAKESDDLYVLEVKATEPMTVCPKCGVVGEVIRFGKLRQELRDTPIHGKHVRLFYQRPRYRCKACTATTLHPVPWLHEDRRATRRLVAAIERDSLVTPNRHVAHKYGVDEKTIKNVLDDYVQHLEHEVRFETPIWLGIDEIHVVGKPRAVFTNIAEETLVEMLQDRNKASIAAYLRTLDTKQVEVVTMDMWRPYRDAVREVIPHAVVVVDKFHVVRLANSAVETVRKGYRKGLDVKQRRQLRNDRFTLLRRRRDLTVFEAGEIETWRRQFPELIAAYEAKENFYGLYDAATAGEAQRRYQTWLAAIPAPLREKGGAWYDMVTAMTNWEREIMAYFQHRVTNAYTESMNRIIRDIDRNGRGYSFPALRAKVLYGQEFRKMKRLASRSKEARRALDDRSISFVTSLPSFSRASLPETRTVCYGADIHRVADYLKERAKQHAEVKPLRKP